MFRSIKFKLWLIFFITLLLSLSAQLLLTHWAMNKRFQDFSMSALEERLPPLEDKIIQVYRREGHLESFRHDPMYWHHLVKDAIYFGPLHRSSAAPLSEQQIILLRRDSGWYKLKIKQKSFVNSLALFDANRNYIAGTPFRESNGHWHPVYLNDSLIAYIGFEKPKYPLRESELLYLDQQFESYLVISGLTVFAALLVAIFISRWLVKPLTMLSDSADKLAGGNFGVRVAENSDDELGTLCKNFNAMAAKLEANEHSRRQWVADISHEMRTPLSVLKAQIEALQDGVRPANPDNLAILANRVDALNHLINDLFELALSDLGALQYEKAPQDLKELLEDFCEENQERAENLGFTFELDCPEEMLVELDQHRLYQVFNNILENSLRYTTAPGRLRWSACREKDRIVILLEDSAPSVPEEALDKIFDRLYRLEQSRNRASGGAGLGLSLCKNIIEAHAGTISAEHSALGGLRLRINLPALEREV